jgi:hypothetical protein
MFTVEIKINGALLSHIYGRNVGYSEATGKSRYKFEYYQCETRKIQNGEVEHRRSDGITALISTILNKVDNE